MAFRGLPCLLQLGCGRGHGSLQTGGGGSSLVSGTCQWVSHRLLCSVEGRPRVSVEGGYCKSGRHETPQKTLTAWDRLTTNH